MGQWNLLLLFGYIKCALKWLLFIQTMRETNASQLCTWWFESSEAMKLRIWTKCAFSEFSCLSFELMLSVSFDLNGEWLSFATNICIRLKNMWIDIYSQYNYTCISCLTELETGLSVYQSVSKINRNTQHGCGVRFQMLYILKFLRQHFWRNVF